MEKRSRMIDAPKCIRTSCFANHKGYCMSLIKCTKDCPFYKEKKAVNSKTRELVAIAIKEWEEAGGKSNG